MLVLIVIAITVLISFTGNLTTYETIASAKQKDGKFVNLIAKLDKTQAMDYDAAKDPNYLAFTAIDTLGNTVKVVYHCLLYTSPSPRDRTRSRMPSSA